MDTDDTVGELFSPAALRIIRRHRPDAEDPRYCRACGRPVASCDVVELARVVAAQLRAVPAHAANVASREEAAAAGPQGARGAQPPQRAARRTRRVVAAPRPQPGPAAI